MKQLEEILEEYYEQLHGYEMGYREQLALTTSQVASTN